MHRKKGTSISSATIISCLALLIAFLGYLLSRQSFNFAKEKSGKDSDTFLALVDDKLKVTNKEVQIESIEYHLPPSIFPNTISLPVDQFPTAELLTLVTPGLNKLNKEDNHSNGCIIDIPIGIHFISLYKGDAKQVDQIYNVRVHGEFFKKIWHYEIGGIAVVATLSSEDDGKLLDKMLSEVPLVITKANVDENGSEVPESGELLQATDTGSTANQSKN